MSFDGGTAHVNMRWLTPPRLHILILAMALPLLMAHVASGQSNEPTTTPTPAEPPTMAQARDWFIAGVYERAIDAYATLADKPENTPAANFALARCKTQLGEYDDALAELIELDAEKSAEWHHLRATLYRLTGRYHKTIEHARKAVGIDKDYAGARFLLGQTQELLGQRDEAIKTYRWFDRRLVARQELPRDAERLTDIALGFLRYSVLTRTNVADRTKHVLNEMLQVAYERVDRAYWPARIAAADLLREKYNNDPDSGSLADYHAALRINERLPQAFVGIGEILLEKWDFEGIEHQVELALDVNPHYAPALHLLAKTRIVERRYRDAKTLCEQALAVNPNDLSALSLTAAASACMFDTVEVERVSQRVRAISPRCATLHRTLGDALGGIRQYEDSEREYLKAIEYDPTDANAHTELGMMYMQWGEEEKAHQILEAAWALDPFNQRTHFTLELLEKLGKFSRIETDHFIVRHDPERDPGLGRFVARHMEDVYDEVTGDYNTTLTDKTVIELFPTHRAFAVRITGKPWIYTIGACTGRVIALASPRDETSGMGPYDITRVLTHEFTHTVTLAATHNRIPHWFTEGLAVFQENAPRPFTWVTLLAESVRADRLFTLESIDWGFMRPRRPDDRQLAYAQSEWMCEYIVERFGYDALNDMIVRFREGEVQRDVFVDRLKIDPTGFDRAFKDWARSRVKQWGFDLAPPEDPVELRKQVEEHPDDAALLSRLARAEFDRGNYDQARKDARRAIDLDKDEPDALEVLGTVLVMLAREEKNEPDRRTFEDEAEFALRRLLDLDPDGWTAPRLLGEIALRRDNHEDAASFLERLQRHCPMDPTSWRGLAGIHLERGDYDEALPQLTELARIDGGDPQVPVEIARIHKRRGRLPEAQYWYRRALSLDPFSVETHKDLGDTCMKAGDTRLALTQYRILTELEPERARHFESAAYAANKLGDTDQARSLAERAIQLDPSSDARSLLP